MSSTRNPMTGVEEGESGERGPLPGGVLAQLGPFLILAAVAAYLRWHWNDIPERFPIHWDLEGAPNGWAAKSLFGVFGTIFIGASSCAFTLLIAIGIVYGSRSAAAGGTRTSATRRMRNLNLLVVLGVSYSMAFVTARAALLPLTGRPGAAFFLIVP